MQLYRIIGNIILPVADPRGGHQWMVPFPRYIPFCLKYFMVICNSKYLILFQIIELKFKCH